MISIVLATYNRSNLLPYVLDCVERQTVTDWELWVIGDACTDETQKVIEERQNPRIHYVNLEKNSGNQATPNNEGVKRSAGKYIAFLNHDDLWLPDHLATLVEGIEEMKADLVFSLAESIDPKRGNFLIGVMPNKRYEPRVFVPASLWLFRRPLFEEIGPWTTPDRCFNVPSQEWLLRAHKKGKKMLLIPKLTAVLIQSGLRPGCYANREEGEHREYFHKIIKDPKFREKEILSIALDLVHRDPLNCSHMHVQLYLVKALKNIVKRLLCTLGISIPGFVYFLKYWKKGGHILHLKKVRGLK